MAAITIGLTSVIFGLAEESGVVVQNFTSTKTSETTELSAHNGVHSAVAFSNQRINVSLSGNSTTAPSDSIGAALSLQANADAVSAGNYFVTDISSTQTVDGFHSFDISATQYPNLST